MAKRRVKKTKRKESEIERIGRGVGLCIVLLFMLFILCVVMFDNLLAHHLLVSNKPGIMGSSYSEYLYCDSINPQSRNCYDYNEKDFYFNGRGHLCHWDSANCWDLKEPSINPWRVLK